MPTQCELRLALPLDMAQVEYPVSEMLGTRPIVDLEFFSDFGMYIMIYLRDGIQV